MSKARAQSTAPKARAKATAQTPSIDAYRNNLSATGAALAAFSAQANAGSRAIYTELSRLETKINEIRCMARVMLQLGQPDTDQADMFQHFGSHLFDDAGVLLDAYNNLHKLTKGA